MKICRAFAIGKIEDLPGVSTEFEKDLGEDGAPDLSQSFHDNADKNNTTVLSWKDVKISESDVDLLEHCGQIEYSIAYAHAEIESVYARETVLSCGSDHGIQVWFNGQSVIERDLNRGYVATTDKTPIRPNAGVNRVLVKISQHKR